MKKHVYRVGDVVRIVEPRFVERVGYPLVWPMLMPEFEAKLDQARDMMSALIIGSIPENAGFAFDKRRTSEANATDRDFLKGVCMAAVRIRGFGGSERSLHYLTDPGKFSHLRGAQREVAGRRIVKTGVRFASNSWQSCQTDEWDYEPGGLSGMRTHTLLTVDHMEIEACDVELVRAAEPMFYIRNAKAVVGNSLLWWRPDGAGYTCDLRKAWKVPESKARSICRDRPEEDFMVPAKKAEASTELHVDSQLFPLHNRKRQKSIDDLRKRILGTSLGSSACGVCGGTGWVSENTGLSLPGPVYGNQNGVPCRCRKGAADAS